MRHETTTWNGERADLREADLDGADLDYAAWPLALRRLPYTEELDEMRRLIEKE